LDTYSIRSFHTQGHVGFAVFEDDENIIYAAYRGVYRLNIKTGEEFFLFNALNDKSIRYNDGKWDPQGRLLLGTSGYKGFERGKNFLYSWDGQKISEIVSNTTISNGIDWFGEYMFFIDSPTKKIGRYFYDKSGNATFDKYVVEIKGAGMPDGMCINEEGSIYVAIYGGSRVEKYSQDGTLLSTLQMPVKNVTSVCIVKDKLYITTAQHDDGSESEPMAGGLFVTQKF